MTSWIVVGTKDCPTQKIVLLMKQSEDYHNFHEKWQSFAANLTVNQVDIKALRRKFDLGSIQLTEAVSDVIEMWVGKTGSGATLDKLIDALKLNDLNSIAELLKGEFQLKSSCWNVPSYYISRTLVTRNVLNETFTEKLLTSEDIFVFAGVSHSKLYKVLRNQIPVNSTAIVHQGSINHNYILLDFPTHFRKVCEKAKCPVHLIKYDQNEDKWIHVKSSGNLSVIQEMIDKGQIRLTETEFIDYLKSEDQSVCISDSPGMGKSTLLQHLGQRLSKTENNRKVLFATMNEIVAVFMQNDANDEVERKALLELTLNKLFCSNATQTSSLSLKLNSKDVEMELLLDGLDEVTSSNTSVALDLLEFLSTIPSIRVWVTTKPHLLQDVENCLNVFGYNIQAFTKPNQIRFLKDFWLSRNKDLVIDRLEQFAEICLSELNLKMSRKDGEIAGIPLQCLMIGEVYMEQAEEHSVAENPNETWIIHINSLVELYQRLIEKQYTKYKVTWSYNLLTEEQVYRQHIKLAVRLIFPELLEDLPVSFKEDVNLNELLKVGLLEKSSTVLEPKFVHRTIGEFYIAKFLVQLLNLEADSESRNCLSQFLNQVLVCQEDAVVLFSMAFKFHLSTNYFVKNEICHFLDTLLVECDKVFRFDTNLNFNHLLQACTYGDYFNIFKKIVVQFRPTEKSSTQRIFDENLLLLTVKYSGISFLKIILENNPTLLENPNTKTKSLFLSIRNGKLAQLRYLLNLTSLLRELVTHPNKKTKLVVHECVHYSVFDSSSTVQQKIEILEILLDINSDLLEQLDNLKRTPILCYGIHPELLKDLIKRQANIFAKDIFRNTILHVHSSDLDVMFKELQTEKLKVLVKLKNAEGQTPLMTLVKQREPSLEVLNKFKKLGADFNCEDDQGYSLLASSIIKRTTETISRLIELGANVHWKKGWKRKSLLHIAAQGGNVDAMRFLESQFKMNINERDWSCKTPGEYLRETYKTQGYMLSNQQLNNVCNLTKDLNLGLSSENKTAMLQRSVRYMNVSAVEHFLKDGADFLKNNDIKCEIVDELIRHFKLEPGSKILKSLINSGIIEVHNHSLIVFTNERKWFLLHWVAQFRRIEIVTCLVDEYNQNVNAADDDGKTPLQALMIGSIFDLEIADFFLSKEADSTVLDGDGNTLLHLAAWRGKNESVRWCLNLGFDVNAANANGESPLHKAASHISFLFESELVCIVYLLCDHGANVLQVDKKGRSVLHHLACSYYLYEKVLNYFVEKGVDINAVDNEGNTPLHIAANNLSNQSNDDGRVKLLLEKGADKTIRNKNGKTPYEIRKLKILKL